MIEVIIDVIKLLYIFSAVIVLLLMILLTNSEQARLKIEKYLRTNLENLGFTLSKRKIYFINRIATIFGAISVPLISLTTILSIPPHGIGWIEETHNLVDYYFWELFILNEAVVFLFYFYSKSIIAAIFFLYYVSLHNKLFRWSVRTIIFVFFQFPILLIISSLLLLVLGIPVFILTFIVIIILSLFITKAYG